MTAKPNTDDSAGTTDQPLMWRLIDEAVTEVARQRRFDTEAMRLVFTLRAASGIVSHDLRQRLRDADAASHRGLVALLMLHVRGEIEQGDLVRHGGFSKAAASALVDQLADEGLVVRRGSRRDRRIVLLTLTDAGRAAFQRDFAVFNAGESAWASGLTPEERTTLVALLQKLVESNIGDRWDQNFA